MECETSDPNDSNGEDDDDEDGEAMDDYDDTNDDDDSCYEIEDGNGNTEDDGDDDNDGSVKLMVRRRMKIMTVLTMKNLFLMICWESMIGNQLATVIMRLWQVFHIIY